MREKLLLPVSHFAAFTGPLLMVVTDYMEQPMNNQGQNSFVKGDAGRLCFLAGPFKRDYNIAYQFTREIRVLRPAAVRGRGSGRRDTIARNAFKIGKGYDVGRLVPSEELPVELPYLPVIDKEDAYVPIL